MASREADRDSNAGTETTTAYTALTPTSTAGDFLEDFDPLGDNKLSTSAVPWPGSTFIIRCVKSGRVLTETLRDGQVVLDLPGSHGCIHWVCVENKGWLGFQSRSSGNFLGHDDRQRLHCSAKNHYKWEYFCPRPRPDGGYDLLMTHWDRLSHVGIKSERGVEKLAKVGHDGIEGIVWEFVKV